MDISITNVGGWTTIRAKGKEMHIRQKRKDFLKDEFNIELKSIHKIHYIHHETTHDNKTLTPENKIKTVKTYRNNGKYEKEIINYEVK